MLKKFGIELAVTVRNERDPSTPCMVPGLYSTASAREGGFFPWLTE